MNRIEIKDFSIKIDKDKVLKTLGCFEGSSVYETVSSYFDELEETVMDLLSPRAVAVTEDMKAYCILTVSYTHLVQCRKCVYEGRLLGLVYIIFQR